MNNLYNKIINTDCTRGDSMRIFLSVGWKLKDIIKNLPTISRQGFNAIELSPLQPLKTNREDIPWYLYFQPIGFRIGNQIGSKDELIDLCNKARKYNIKIIADVICNHVANGDLGEFRIHQNVDNELRRDEFFKPKETIYNWDDRHEVITKCLHTMPGLNLANHDLQNIIIRFLNEYIHCGVRGFRFDAAKNIALPEEEYPFSSSYSCDFWTRVLGSLKHKDELFNYAEVIYYPRELIDMYTKYINVITQNVGSDPDKIVSYISNHDTEEEFGSTRHMSDESIIDSYRILSRSFKNTQFYARPYHDNWMYDEKLRMANMGM